MGMIILVGDPAGKDPAGKELKSYLEKRIDDGDFERWYRRIAKKRGIKTESVRRRMVRWFADTGKELKVRRGDIEALLNDVGCELVTYPGLKKKHRIKLKGEKRDSLDGQWIYYFYGARGDFGSERFDVWEEGGRLKTCFYDFRVEGEITEYETDLYVGEFERVGEEIVLQLEGKNPPERAFFMFRMMGGYKRKDKRDYMMGMHLSINVRYQIRVHVVVATKNIFIGLEDARKLLDKVLKEDVEQKPGVIYEKYAKGVRP